MTRVPAPALVVGWAGLLPFVYAVLLIFSAADTWPTLGFLPSDRGGGLLILERFGAAARHIVNSTAPLPDFVLLQEVWFPSQGDLLVEALRPRYEPVDVPRTWFPGRAGGLLTFVRRDSGWRVRRSSFHPFSTAASAWRFWEGDGLASKGVQRIDVERDDEERQ